jgi:lipopolysaccharide transport system ATP-binding protein
MQLRLGFSVAVHTDPEILLIDEILAVGDMAFQRKCLDRIVQFKAEGCAILLVSHDANAIQQLCDEAAWLRRGELVAAGPASVVVEQYAAEMRAETQRRTPASHPVQRTPGGAELRVNENRFGSMELEIVSVHLLDRHGLPVTELDAGAPLRVEIEYSASKPVPAPNFGATITKEDGTVCYDTSPAAEGVQIPTVEGQGKIALQIERLDLIGGQYHVDVWVYDEEWTYAYDYHWHVYPLAVRPTGWIKGVLWPPARWESGARPGPRRAE